mmetsp:Transcript_655/g.2449  ORF Transcript_655/g.2449 Transcript_655/m.2449 type:complete len:130 (+) Transcript_655:45-434(+)
MSRSRVAKKNFEECVLKYGSTIRAGEAHVKRCGHVTWRRSEKELKQTVNIASSTTACPWSSWSLSTTPSGFVRNRRKKAQECDVVLKAQWNQVNLMKEAKWTQQPAATTDACSSRADERLISTCMKILR